MIEFSTGGFLVVGGNCILLLNLQCSLKILRIISPEGIFVMNRNQDGRICEQVVHLLERQPLCLRKEEIEEDCVGEIADDEQMVVSVSHVSHRKIGDLSNECVEGEVMVAIETPLDRVRVSKISAGMIQESGPQVAEKE